MIQNSKEVQYNGGCGHDCDVLGVHDGSKVVEDGRESIEVERRALWQHMRTGNWMVNWNSCHCDVAG